MSERLQASERSVLRTVEDEAQRAAAELESAEECAGGGVERSILAAEAAVEARLACMPLPTSSTSSACPAGREKALGARK